MVPRTAKNLTSFACGMVQFLPMVSSRKLASFTLMWPVGKLILWSETDLFPLACPRVVRPLVELRQPAGTPR